MDTETKPPTRMGKKELINALQTLGYSEEDLLDNQGNKLKRPALLEKLQAHKQGEEGLAVLLDIDDDGDDIGVEVEPDAKEDKRTTDIPIKGLTTDVTTVDEFASEEFKDDPTPNDPEWTQYVIEKFLPDEVDGKNPRVDGLRRVAGKLVGELIEEGCDLVATPSEDNRFRACVKAWGVFVNSEGIQKRFEALADAHAENCLEDYATYLVAMADTRAKGRMFRNALCLRRTVAAEEINKTMAITADIQPGGAIHIGQISMIRLIADRYNFSIPKVLDELEIEYKLHENTGDVNLQAIRYEDALAVVKKMREMREEKEKK